MEPLAEARDLVLETPLNHATKTRKLSRITFAAVGVDNIFAAETSNEVTGDISRRQVQQQLSLIMQPSLRQILRSGSHAEVNNYPDLVVAAFHESMGRSDYFGPYKGVTAYTVAPYHQKAQARKEPLDILHEGFLALDAFRGISREPFDTISQLIGSVNQHRPLSIRTT